MESKYEKVITITSDDYSRVVIPKKVREDLNIQGDKFSVDFIVGDKYIILREHQEEFNNACKILEELMELVSRAEECKCFGEDITTGIFDVVQKANVAIDKYLLSCQSDAVADCLENFK